MAQNVEMFDLERPEFERWVKGTCIPFRPGDTGRISALTLRNAVGFLASLIWVLAQRVKELEREE